jgi:hypothetical protein
MATSLLSFFTLDPSRSAIEALLLAPASSLSNLLSPSTSLSSPPAIPPGTRTPDLPVMLRPCKERP